jgi:hypothetical protein
VTPNRCESSKLVTKGPSIPVPIPGL